MLTKYEKNEFVEKTEKITERIFENKKESVLFFKVLVNYLEKTNVNNLQINQLSDRDLENPEKMKDFFSMSLHIMADIAAEESEFAPTYTTGQLAKYFGVSITTINNWINNGRFKGVNKTGKHAQARISANAIWISKTGKMYPISEIVNDWEEAQAANGENKFETNEIEFLVEQMALYEGKYGGNFENTLGKVKKLSPEEETDATTWSYFKDKFDNLNAD